MLLRAGSRPVTVRAIRLQASMVTTMYPWRGSSLQRPEDFGEPVDVPELRLAGGEVRRVPFAVPLPWGTPVTELHGRPLDATVTIRTVLTHGWKQRVGTTSVSVAPLPLQEALLDGFGRLGFRCGSAPIRPWRIDEAGMRDWFHQEIALEAPPSLARVTGPLLILTFVNDERGSRVLLRPAVWSGIGHRRPEGVAFSVTHADHDRTDWRTKAARWVAEFARWRRDRRRTVELVRPETARSSLLDGGSPLGSGSSGGLSDLASAILVGEIAEELLDEYGSEEEKGGDGGEGDGDGDGGD